MSNSTLTQTQTLCLQFIKQYVKEKGYCPSIREIQAHYGYRSATSVVDILDALRDKGLIESTPNVARSIRVLDPSRDQHPQQSNKAA